MALLPLSWGEAMSAVNKLSRMMPGSILRRQGVLNACVSVLLLRWCCRRYRVHRHVVIGSSEVDWSKMDFCNVYRWWSTVYKAVCRAVKPVVIGSLDAKFHCFHKLSHTSWQTWEATTRGTFGFLFVWEKKDLDFLLFLRCLLLVHLLTVIRCLLV